GNLSAELLVAPEESQSGIAVVKHKLPPKKLAAPLHRHSREDEISYILKGEMGVQEGRESESNIFISTVEAGESIVKERDTWHTFWNPGSEELVFLETIAPGDFAYYFEEVAELIPGNEDENDGDENELDIDAETVKQLERLHQSYGFEI
ncbi:MAG: cupin domain-containing protein, partial [Halobacteria archaeon]|nr:cupin domain-containing protein [Halobacteria archaeon]